jgi:cytochrome c556
LGFHALGTFEIPVKRLTPSHVALAAALIAAVSGCTSTSHPKASLSIEQIMEDGFKGKESLSARISKGQGNEADFKKMAMLTKELALNKPSKGDLASWTEKTQALQAAADSLVAGKPGALDGFKSAVNCKACHSVHKGD